MWWPQIPMSVSPICVSGISVLHFRTCWISALYFRTWRSLDKLWIFRVWPATFKYRRADGSKTAKTPSTLQACSFFSNPFLPVEFCLSTLGPAFSFIMLFQIFIQAFDTLKITEHRFGTRDTLKQVDAWAFCKHFFSCYALFRWIWTNETYDLADYQLAVGSFLRAITFMWSGQRIPGRLQFFQQRLFPSQAVPSLLYFEWTIIIFLSFHVDFLYASLAAPIISYLLFSNLRCSL